MTYPQHPSPGGSTPPVSTELGLHSLVWSRPARRPFTAPQKRPRQWSRYERLSFSMLGVTWGILVLAVAALHLGNYHLDTKTSSTSGSHSGFYESAKSLKSDTPAQESSR
ncbi:hypothetical protein [Comamonas sp. JUb58]|uniref:hypothetical protein n=1 Tax=Comamonas sp. JUb58 TaxID=2485114 RepID=UPI00105D2FAE|nr:hypothetical protein [Comamonas sp. JUb58]